MMRRTAYRAVAALALTTLLVGGQVASYAHFAATPHIECSDDGELIKVAVASPLKTMRMRQVPAAIELSVVVSIHAAGSALADGHTLPMSVVPTARKRIEYDVPAVAA